MDSNMVTAVVQIGNSDNKLKQGEWSHFCHAVAGLVADAFSEIHFSGGSEWNAPWQNACWCGSINIIDVEIFKRRIAVIRKSWNQDSVAILVGQTQFV